MIVEENVNVENSQTEAVAIAKEGLKKAPQTENSTVLGKFKDVDALARAYEALQAEFTRRSQKLRVLEKEVENFKTLAGGSGAEKLRKTAKARREAAKEFDAFVAEVDGQATEEKPTSLEVPKVEPKDVSTDTPAAFAEEFADGEKVDLAEEFAKKQSPIEGIAEGEVGKATRAINPPMGEEDARGAAEGEASAIEDSREEASSEALFRKAVEDENVRLRIVGEYLASLGKSGAPLTGSKAGVLAAPPRRATTVGQAGDMALLYFRKPTVD